MALTKNRKKFIILAGVLSLFLFLGSGALAACPTEGVVPCGTSDCPCTLCHLFSMIERIIKEIMEKLVPAIAVLLIVYSGFLLITGRGDVTGEGKSEKVNKGKKALTAVVVGLFIVYGSYIAVNEMLRAVGFDMKNASGGVIKWYQIDCPTP